MGLGRLLRIPACRLEFDANAVGDAVHEGELGGDRADVVDRAIVEAPGAQGRDVAGAVSKGWHIKGGGVRAVPTPVDWRGGQYWIRTSDPLRVKQVL